MVARLHVLQSCVRRFTERDDGAPGGAIVFELWHQGGQEDSVRTYYVLQTQNQMRKASRASLENVPAKAVSFLPAIVARAPLAVRGHFLVWTTGPLTLHLSSKGNVIEQPPAYIQTWFMAPISSTPLFSRHVCQKFLVTQSLTT